MTADSGIERIPSYPLSLFDRPTGIANNLGQLNANRPVLTKQPGRYMQIAAEFF